VNVRHPHAQFPTIAFPNGNINAGVKSNRIGFELERNDEQWWRNGVDERPREESVEWSADMIPV